MSAPSGKAGASQPSKAADTEAATKPVSILPTSQAQIVRHAHPVLLGGFFYARFNALVQDPVATMWSSAPVILAIQIAYTILCLPPAGADTTKPAKKLRPGEKKKSGADGAGPNIAVTTTVALLLTIFSALPLHLVFVLFGAPFLTHLSNTLLCSLHLSLLGLYPIFYSRGVDANEWLEILGARAPFDEGFGGLLGGCLGAWLGAVPIPLDWDREWQKWPVTILVGVYGGYVLGKLVGGTVAYGKRFA
ncbi:putative Glycosylphosphatidylinositol anchor biosynthesis protein 11 [Seiridium unicorne]|uniref:Glycosylphosphatidylinositol anchor biosynthesis protein 11 n=1 Tax=Seiridium unicorne TaxID=138068 RepID=A0ABR2V3H3_9PEZI